MSATPIRRLWSRPWLLSFALLVTGLTVILVISPNLIDETRSFRFERPPDPAEVRFNPPALTAAIGYVFVVTGLVAIGFLASGSVWQKWASRVQMVPVVLMLPLLLAISLGRSDLSGTNVVEFVNQSLVLATPIALGAMTGLWSERVGIINIGIEGMMLSAAGVGFMTYALVGSGSSPAALWLSVLVAILVGGLLAIVLAVLAIQLNINQIVAGVVINLFAVGMTGFLRSQVIVKSEVGMGTPTPEFGIPLLSSIPIVGPQLFTGRPIYFAMYGVVFTTWLVMFRTAWGLRVRACGEDPEAVESVGVDVVKTRYLSVLIGGFIAGLAGAWFSLEAQARFEDNMTQAAGFIALAAMIFGRWRPWGALGGAVLFGTARALQTRLQILKVDIAGFEIPSEWWQSVPFVITIVVVAGLIGRAVPPAAEGRPFTPSK